MKIPLVKLGWEQELEYVAARPCSVFMTAQHPMTYFLVVQLMKYLLVYAKKHHGMAPLLETPTSSDAS